MPKGGQPVVVAASAAALRLDEAREDIPGVDEEEFISPSLSPPKCIPIYIPFLYLDT
jgi:hypothetical protein